MSSSAPPPNERREEKTTYTPTASAVLPTGELVEMVYDPKEAKTRLVVGTADAWGYEESLVFSPTERLVPYSAKNNLVRHGVVLFASEPAEYGTEAELVALVRDFIRRHVELAPEFEEIATYYALFTWVYDAFHEVPYVRVRGGYGSGKTRFLLTVGSLCRLPIFATAASTVSPIFRLLDSFQGTLILDEGDFRYSDEKSEIVKILNNGNAEGFPVLRTEVSSKREFDPRAYRVFGPKLIATRGFFQDRALESRCLTEDMRGGALSREIPLNLNDSFREEARMIRNRLLLYRLRTFNRVRTIAPAAASGLDPRLLQIFGPLLSVIEDEEARTRIVQMIGSFNEDILEERSASAEAQALAVIRDLVAKGPDARLAIQDIAREFMARHGTEYERRITPRWVGSIVRRRLGLRASRSTGVFTLGPEEVTRLKALYTHYGIAEGDQIETNQSDAE
jgi:hypothetical protein